MKFLIKIFILFNILVFNTQASVDVERSQPVCEAVTRLKEQYSTYIETLDPDQQLDLNAYLSNGGKDDYSGLSRRRANDNET